MSGNNKKTGSITNLEPGGILDNMGLGFRELFACLSEITLAVAKVQSFIAQTATSGQDDNASINPSPASSGISELLGELQIRIDKIKKEAAGLGAQKEKCLEKINKIKSLLPKIALSIDSELMKLTKLKKTLKAEATTYKVNRQKSSKTLAKLENVHDETLAELAQLAADSDNSNQNFTQKNGPVFRSGKTAVLKTGSFNLASKIQYIKSNHERQKAELAPLVSRASVFRADIRRSKSEFEALSKERELIRQELEIIFREESRVSNSYILAKTLAVDLKKSSAILQTLKTDVYVTEKAAMNIETNWNIGY